MSAKKDDEGEESEGKEKLDNIKSNNSENSVQFEEAGRLTNGNHNEDSGESETTENSLDVSVGAAMSFPSTSSQAYGGARPKVRTGAVGDAGGLKPVKMRISVAGVSERVSSGVSESVSMGESSENLERDGCSVSWRQGEAGHESDRESEQGDSDCVNCTYTYKGGGASLTADLPHSFFRLDSGSETGETLPGVAGAGQSNLSTGVAVVIQDQLMSRRFSPDQDFIEMDFLSDSSDESSESSGDSGQGREEPEQEIDGQQQLQRDLDIMEDPLELEIGEPAGISVAHPTSSVLLLPTNNNLPSAKTESVGCRDCDQEERPSRSPLLPAPYRSPLPQPPSPLPPQPHPISLPLSNTTAELPFFPLHPSGDSYSHSVPPQPSSAPVLSPCEDSEPPSLPRSRSLNSSLGSCPASSHSHTKVASLSLCGTRLSQREALIFKVSSPRAGVSTEALSPVPPLPPPCPPARAMLWSEKEALGKQVSQLGPSACGATALVNVGLAMRLSSEQVRQLGESVSTRLRRGESQLADYLLSRAEAGCTHEDLINGAHTSLPGHIVTRFFPMHRRNVQLSPWLASFLSVGCVPVVTLNPQVLPPRGGEDVADAWHHQMVWGVSGPQVYLTNPLEMVSVDTLLPQLTSDSVLLVRRADVLQRVNSQTDLMDIDRLGERWASHNVVGQVANLLREERKALLYGCPLPTSHLRVPASYSAGVTIFCLASNQKGVARLRSAMELPYSDQL